MSVVQVHDSITNNVVVIACIELYITSDTIIINQMERMGEISEIIENEIRFVLIAECYLHKYCTSLRR